MKKALRILVPILLLIAILGSIAWYLFDYDRSFTQEMLLRTARYFEENGKHPTAAWFYDLAYKQSGNDEDVAIELAERFKAIGNYTKAEYTLSNAIADGGTVELYIALCKTYVEQDKLLDAVDMLDKISNPQTKAELDARRPAAPTADLEPGFYNQYLDVTVSASSGTLYLTTDGEYPSVADGAHDGIVSLPGGETTIYAVAVGEDGLVSPVSIFGYIVGGVIEEVTFSDSAMEQAIRETLNVASETVIYTDELWDIKEFTVPEGVTAFDDLAKLPYLTSLTISGGSLESCGVLTKLQYLQKLSITDVSLSTDDLQIIAALPNLTDLTLSGCSLSNITYLSAAQGLKTLDLSSNAIRDIDAIGSMLSLEELHLQHNALTGLNALGSLSNLKTLDVSYNSLTSIAAISTCVGLEKLDVTENDLANLGALDNLPALTHLYAGYNSLTDVSMLASCASLVELDISNNALTELAGLGDLAHLSYLNFSYNHVTALPVFPVDCALNIIDGSYNDLSDIEALRDLYNLNRVTMDYNEELADISCLENCPLLVQVSVFGTKVSDVSALTAHSIIVHYDPTQAYTEEDPEE